MVSRQTILRALRKRDKVYARVRTSKKGLKTSERWMPFVSKTSARQLVSKSNRRFGKQGVMTKIVRFRKTSPHGR